jgi:hypothetical protein
MNGIHLELDLFWSDNKVPTFFISGEFLDHLDEY